MQPPPEHRIELPHLSTLGLPTHAPPKNLLQRQLKGADQDSKSRINSTREPDLDRHHRDRIDLTFMQPAGKHQPDRQLPSIGELKLLSDTTPTILRQLQGARSSGPPRGQSKRNREEAPRQEAPEQPYQRAYENRKPAPRYPSINAAPPKHDCAGYEVPCGPAVTPNSHRGVSRGQLKRNRHEAPRQEAPEQPYRVAYENPKPAARYRYINAAPPKHACADYEVPCGPAGIIPDRHREMSRGQLERNSQVPPQEARKQQYQSPYESVQATKRPRSDLATPLTHKSADYNVPFGPAGIKPNNHREMSTAQSERDGHEVLQQEAQELQYQSFHQIREAARRYPSGPATSEYHGSAGSGVLIPPPAISIHINMSEADKRTCVEMRTKHPRVLYKKIEVAINHRHSDVEIERYLGQREWFEAKLEKLQRERDIGAGNDTAMTRRAAKYRQTGRRQ